MHMLGHFSAMLREDLSATLRHQFIRQRGSTLRLGDFRALRLPPELRQTRWVTHDTPLGRIGFSVDRSLLLLLLAYRYGTREPIDSLDCLRMDAPETTTEERLFHLLAQRLVRNLLARIHAGLGDLSHDADSPITRAKHGHGAPPANTWVFQAPVHGPNDALAGHLLFALEDDCMDALLRQLAPPPRAAVAEAEKMPPLQQALQFRLHAQLLEKTVALGQVLDLRHGQIIPVALSGADVLIQDSVVFNASVVEHKGKLCLTTFQEK